MLLPNSARRALQSQALAMCFVTVSHLLGQAGWGVIYIWSWAGLALASGITSTAAALVLVSTSVSLVHNQLRSVAYRR